MRDGRASGSFFDTPAGKLMRYRQRKRRRLHILIDDIEPQSKKMPKSVMDAFQSEVIEALEDSGRAAFRGPIALGLRLSTTTHDAPQAQAIAKNLLDLLGERRATVEKKHRKHLLYKDDRQVQALSVSCAHGQERPLIELEARPLADMVDDIELAGEALREHEHDDPDAWHRRDQEWDAVSSFKRLLEHEQQNRARLGDKLYESMVKMERWHAQRALLTRSSITTAQLAWLYGRPKNEFMQPLFDTWDRSFRTAPLRIHMGELPTKHNESVAFTKRIEEEIIAFKNKWGRFISPLVVPVALELVVCPNASMPKAVLHDLDNIVRSYLLPQIVPEFGTVTDHRWTIDFEELRRVDPDLADRWGPKPTRAKGTKDGVSRYEAWRLPPAPAGTSGFVSVALVADTDAAGGLLQQADYQIRHWAESLDIDIEHIRRWG